MTKANPGEFVWYEHGTKDTKAAAAFYGDIVGWKTAPFGADGTYEMWTGGQGPLGGLFSLTSEMVKSGASPNWMGSVLVADVDRTVARAKELGGRVFAEPADIPTVGRYAVIGDPQGASIAVFKPSGDGMDKHDVEKPGEFCWHELLTSDANAAFPFYAELFGWAVIQEIDSPSGKYRVFGKDGKSIGGMMTIACGPHFPPSWMYYAQTPDVEAAVKRATERGAKVMNGPMDVPGGGKIAQLVDPQGAPFALHQNPKN